MNEQQEQAIAQGLQAGDPDAWRTFYDTFCERVWRTAARRVGPNSADVADVVQETFLAAARSAGQFDPRRGPLWAWLTGILRNQIALQFRKKQRHERIRELGVPPGQDRHGRQRAELAALVRETLTELNDDYGSLLTAKYLDQDTVEEIAAAEQTTTTAVRSKLARARRAFRDAFDQLTADSPVTNTGQNHDK
jgi:RNA polymerase sigma-70 factor (ECF subfamily)